jgi:alpha-tubulin suppressor-like RCC1 family protein
MKIFSRLILIALIALISSCEESGSSDAIKDAFETSPTSSGSSVNALCYQDQYATPEEFITRKLDIAIVIDTSSSIIEERAAIAEGFDYLLSQLPSEVDYRVALIVGHGDMTAHSGKLYQKGSEPRVLSSASLTTAEIKNHLKTKMQNPHGDNETDGGELGLYSFLKATNEVNLPLNRQEDFFREDAALTVIFVADEQDICAEYPVGVTPVVDPQGGEDRSHDKYCIDDQGNRIITSQMVVDRITEIQDGSPQVVGGVLYKDNQTMPVNGENEIGYGYIDVVNLAGGITVDMANGEYANGLSNLGKLATVSIQPANDFNLKTNKVDSATIEALVNNISVPFEYNAELNQVHLTNSRDNFSVAKIKYCEKEQKPLEVIKLSAGGFHTCAILLEGDLKCWGQNLYGQLGLGHTNAIGDDELPSSISTINLGAKVKDVSAGTFHTCALLEEGEVKCWGRNEAGQLGLGHTDSIGDDEDLSGLAAIPLKDKATKIYSGSAYNCALLENKNIQCWGNNLFGQLGLGHTDNFGDDETIDTLGYVSTGGSVVQMDISTISFHVCALLQNGDLRCWGRNDSGQLGLGHSDNIGDDELPSSISPVPFGEQVIQLATGNRHTCAITGGQKLRCWGSNSSGQIGTGNSEFIGDNEAVTSIDYVDTGANSLINVSTGNLHTCAVSSNYDAYCFGLGTSGTTGLGRIDNIGDDEAVKDISLVDLGEESISQIASGVFHTCALTKDEGKVICFGDARYGQLGDATTNNLGDDETPGAKYVSILP